MTQLHVDPSLQKNPLLSDFDKNTDFGEVPFEKIHVDHFLPAIEEGIRLARARVESLKKNADKPSFDNTFLVLETISEELDIASEIYFNLLSAEAPEAHQKLAGSISPLLAQFSNDLSLDPALFARVKVAFESLDKKSTDPEKYRVAEKTYKSFVRNGALLDDSGKKSLREFDAELSKLSPLFSENVLKDTYAFEMLLTQPSETEGLPAIFLESSKAAAQEKGHKEGFLVTLEAPSYIPFMTYAKNRSLREKLWTKFSSRCFGGPHSNLENAKKLAMLRHNRARLLGFKSHADYMLSERMAESPSKVWEFLTQMKSASLSAAKKELAEVLELAKKEDKLTEIRPWDFAYYSERLKKLKFDFDEEELRPYFEVNRVLKGVFDHATLLYGLNFIPFEKAQKYHPDVQVFKVVQKDSGHFVGLFYCDFFPRPTKKGGAWMTAIREQGLFSGKVRRPHISIVCNFTKPTPQTPSLLSFDEVRTLFHEFGHALHGLLSDCHFRSIAGTNVYWDFVELPSQIMENWVLKKESLDLFAVHYKTGEKIPQALAEKIVKSSQFLEGWSTVRQLSFAWLDMKWHSQDPAGISDVEEFEKSVLEDFALLPRVSGTAISTSFSHIFAGGYSAGYYSYKWAEVLDADAFEFFETEGIFNPVVAEKFRKSILSRGGSRHPMELYKEFRGREPDPDALLRRAGLI
jgi:peptidyl-dipeptidase Dcp